MSENQQKRVLVIRHGALGDLINVTGAFGALRTHFKKDHLTLLTAPSYQALGEKMGFFDEVWSDARSKSPVTMARMIRKMVRGRFDYIFDLQNSDRTALYYKILGLFGKHVWSGIQPGGLHLHAHCAAMNLPIFERHAYQLKQAGIVPSSTQMLLPELGWMEGDVSGLNLPEKFILLIPGSSLSGSYKRWPAISYAALAANLKDQGFKCVLVAGPEDHEPVHYLRAHVPDLIDLSMKVSLFQIASISRLAKGVIGNDTGPTHIASGVGTPTVVPWSTRASDPYIYAPKGPHIRVLAVEDLTKLSPEEVSRVFFDLLSNKALDSGAHVLASSS